MPYVDALSRHPIKGCNLIEEDEKGMLARVRKAQQKDQEIQKLVAERRSRRDPGFTFQRGLLFREEGGNVKLVIPKVL